MRDDIQAMKDLFYRAHYNTSFSPDVRAASCVESFSEELDADLKELGANPGNYAVKYLDHLRTWASRKSRCLSSMITGPAKFPVEGNRKAMNSEHAAWEEFRRWRERYIRRATAEPTKSPEEELDDALAELEKEIAHHDMMLAINRIVRAKGQPIESKVSEISQLFDLSMETAAKLLAPTPGYSAGFQTFELTNHNAKLKRLEQKVAAMRIRIQRKETFEKILFPGGSIDIENDRVVIRHDERPEVSIIKELRDHGFRWSPNWHCWCRKHTGNAIRDAKSICLKSVGSAE
jgi:hypothetical protein